MKKIWFTAAALLCLLLCGCSGLEPVDGVQLRNDLAAYYENQVYRVDDVEERLILPYAPQVIEQTIDNRKNTANLQCRAQAVSEHQLFFREDSWELWYTYDRKNKCWTLTDKDYTETAYGLMSDLTQELCTALMPVPDGQPITLRSVTTDREAMTAAAVYTYSTVTAQYGEYGYLTMNAVVQANFVWQADGGWQYTDSVLTDETSYAGLLGCYIGDDGADMDSAQRCSIGFDLLVFGDLICIENLRYSGGALTDGTLHIGKTTLTAADDGRAAVIKFSYVRNSGEEQGTIAGEGSITITAGDDGNYYAELFLGSFITDSNGNPADLTRGGIPLEPVRGYEEPEPEVQPEVEPEPQTPVVEEPKRNWVGTWVGQAPEEFGFDLDVTALLRENGTCEVVCKIFLLGTMRRETTYLVVEDISELPTDMLALILLGQTPTVAVVYDAQRDVLYTCLDQGMYIYLAREGSGEMGGLYEP